jgi:DNA-binding response OmpR family regulator
METPVAPLAGTRSPVVLLVDDSADDREMYATFLSVVGHCHVLEAASGRDALNVLSHESPDVMVLDLVLPQIDGLAVYSAFRDLSNDTPRPVVGLTALPHDSLAVSRLISAGVDTVLFKPCAPDALLSQIRIALARSRSLRGRANAEQKRSATLINRSHQLLAHGAAAVARCRDSLDQIETSSSLQRAKADYHDMPGLSLTEAQARRLWGMDDLTCRRVLDALVADGYLVKIGDLFKRPPTR